MKSYQVLRTHTSPYQRSDFIQREKSLLEGLPGVQYKTLENINLDEKNILITNTHTQLSKIPPDVVKNTKLIIHPNSGYDNFSSDQHLWNNIPIVVGHEIRAQAVAEYILGCLLQGGQGLPQHIRWNKERNWNRKLLKNQTVHIFGHGHIGRIIASTLHALGMKVTVIDPFIKNCPYPLFKTWKEDNIENSNIILACMGLNTSNKRIFNEDFFNSLNNEVLFINAARGGLVEESALKNYLQNNPKSFAFLDVFENEPFTDEWHNFPQVWKTSHIAGVHQNLGQEILDFEKKVLGDFLILKENEFKQKYENELLQNKWIQGELI